MDGCVPLLPAALDAMLQSLESQCRMANQLVAIAKRAPDESDPDLVAFAAQVDQLETILAAHDAALQAEEEALQQVQETLLPELRQMNQQLRAQQQGVEDGAAMIAAQARQSSARRPPLSDQTNAPSAAPPASVQKPAGSLPVDPSALVSSLSPSRLRMEPVSAEEFQSIPSYMRGRLDRPKLQAALDAWGALLRAKYALMATPAAQLDEAQRRQVVAWRGEEDDETDGRAFLSSEDVRQCAELQSLGSTNLKAVLVGLRHLGRVKNSTASGSTKYILL